MQFIQGQGPIICQFEPPITDKTHMKAEAIVLEGKYWKRRMESVTAEYKKWRLFYKKKFAHDNRGMLDVIELDNSLLLDRVEDTRPAQQATMYSMMDQLMEDDFSMDFSDTLFTTLNQQGFQFPNPKEMSCLGNADIIQPGLIQLQPNFDDFLMDTLEPLPSLQGKLGTKMLGSGASTSTKSESASVPISSGYTDTPLDTSTNQGLSNLSNIAGVSSLLDGQSSLAQTAASTGILPTPSPSVPIQQSAPTTTTAPIPMDQDSVATQILNLLMAQTQQQQQQQVQQVQQPQPQQQTLQPQVTMQYQPSQIPIAAKPVVPRQTQAINLSTALNQQPQHQPLGAAAITLPAPAQGVPVGATTINPPAALGATTMTLHSGQLVIQGGATTLQTLLQGLPVEQLSAASIIQQQPIQQPQQQQQQQPTVNQHLQRQSGLLLQNIKQQSLETPKASSSQAADIPRRASTGSVLKQDGFRVPQQPPASSRVKQRNIAPSHSAPTVTQQPQPQQQQQQQPKSSVVQQNTFLAQLLMTGTYPAIKTEPPPGDSTVPPAKPANYAPIRPAPAHPAPAPVTTTASASSTSAVAFALSNTTGLSEFLGKSNVIFSSSPQASASPATSHKAPSPTPGSCFSPGSAGLSGFTIGSTSRTAPSPSQPPPVTSVTSAPDSPAMFPGSPDSDPGVRSPGKARVKVESERGVSRENRRVSHISAEHKRRCNIKYGFDTLHQLVPSLRENPNQKISKAATLQKTAEFCKKLKTERAQMQDEAEVLRQEIESLNSAISVCQSQLPATGVPVTRQRADQMKEMFHEYVKQRTLQNWKFYIFSRIIAPLFDSYNNMVSTASFDEVCRTTLTWLDQHCSLVALRPGVLQSLTQLSTTTSILSDPSKVPEQATAAVTQSSPRQRHHSSQN